MNSRTLAAAIAAICLDAMPALAADQFNLVCKGTVETKF